MAEDVRTDGRPGARAACRTRSRKQIVQPPAPRFDDLARLGHPQVHRRSTEGDDRSAQSCGPEARRPSALVQRVLTLRRPYR